jgi:soluble lytic murein transglycosylase
MPRIIRHHARLLLLGTLLAVGLTAPAPAADADAQRQAFKSAYLAYRQGDATRGDRLAAGLEGHPLWPYLRHEQMRRRLTPDDADSVRAFIAADGGSWLGEQLRSDWLALLARHGRWSDLIADYAPQKDTAMHCRYLAARVRQDLTAGLYEEVRKTWLTGRSLPAECDPALAWFKARPEFGDGEIWARIELAMSEGQAAFAGQIARGLPAADRRLVEVWRQIHERPDSAAGRPELAADTATVHRILRHAVERLAKKDATRADTLWTRLRAGRHWSPDQADDMATIIAVAAVRQDHEQSIELLDQVPPDLATADLQRARLMAALRTQDWRRLQRWTEQPAAADMNALRWRYWRARAFEELGDRAAAEPIYAELAGERDYYGWVAAEHLGRPYEFRHQPLRFDEAAVEAFGKRPGIVRAREFYTLGMMLEARREWQFEINRLDAAGLTTAAVAAHRWDWHDRAIFALGKAREYADLEIRFPLAFRPLVEEYAGRRGLEPAVMLSIIRSESAFSADARSPVGALGLMQVMPATGRQTAQKVGYRLKTDRDLLAAENNLLIGSAYLKSMLDRFDGSLALAAAAYNAGPHRAAKWRPREDCVPADLWVDTIPFTETRRYVRNVLFYTALYESRLQQPVKPAGDRLAVTGTNGERHRLSCGA